MFHGMSNNRLIERDQQFNLILMRGFEQILWERTGDWLSICQPLGNRLTGQAVEIEDKIIAHKIGNGHNNHKNNSHFSAISPTDTSFQYPVSTTL